MPLTDTKLRTVRATGVRIDLTDGHGLTLRVGVSGSMTWTLAYRVAGAGEPGAGRVARQVGPKQRMTLGDYPATSLAEARKRALTARQAAQQGIDPGAAQRRQAGCTTGPMTVTDLVERYAEAHLRRNLRAGLTVERLLHRHVIPTWGDRPVITLTRGDLLRLLEDVREPQQVEVAGPKGGRYEAMRGGIGAAAEVRKWVRALFQYAVDTEIRPDNPFAGVRNRDRAKPRDRVLSIAELRAIWAAATAMPYPWAPFYQLLLLTADRRGEWAAARWDWLDEAWSQLEIPAEHYKTGRSHIVPLGSTARRIVAGLPAPLAGPYLLLADGGMTPIGGFSNAKKSIDDLAERFFGGPMQPWVTHDLRRSMATHMERLGVAPHVIKACLGHALKWVRAPIAATISCARSWRRCKFGKTRCWSQRCVWQHSKMVTLLHCGSAMPLAADVTTQVWKTYSDIVRACAKAWNWFVSDPARISSIDTREWVIF